MQRENRRLAAIVAADIAGYSRLIGQDEEGTLSAFRAHRTELINELIDRHGGRIANTAGDSLLLEFPSAVEAVRCAIAIQEGMAERNRAIAPERQILFRIGVNVGDVIAEGDDLLGDGVNVAARLENLCEPNGVVLSDDAYRQVRDRLDMAWTDGGAHDVKNIARPIQIWRWSLAAAPEATPPEIAAAPAPPQPPSPLPLPDKPSIVVLPFDNMSGDPDQDYFADGLAEDLITDLSKIGGLFVIARNSAFSYKGKQVDVRTIAHELGVRFVLEGSVRRAGDQVRINAQLIDATTGGHLWAERFDGDISNIFGLQDDVGARIVSAMKVELTPAERTRVNRTPTDNPRAYELLLKARAALRRAPQGLVEALSLFEQAIDIDPSFAEAYAGYANLAAIIWSEGFVQILPAPTALARARQHTARALALDPENALAHITLAWINLFQHEHSEAIRAAEIAVQLNPNGARGYFRLAEVHVAAGEPFAAASALEKGLRLEPRPRPELKIGIGWLQYRLRQYENAIATCAETREQLPDSLPVWTTLPMAASHAYLGQAEAAQAAMDHVRAAWPAVNRAFYYLYFSFLRRTEQLEHDIEGFRLAGMPEWPFGFEGREEDLLTGAEIKTLYFGHRIEGIGQAMGPYKMSSTGNGEWKGHFGEFDVAGSMSLDGGDLWIRSDGIMRGQRFRMHIYRNPNGTPEKKNEYISCDVHDLREFTVVGESVT